MRTRAEHLAALVGVTVADIADDFDTATAEDDYWTALLAALLKPGYVDMLTTPKERPIFTRVTAARVRAGLTTSEATRKATAREAEQRLMNQRAARRAS